MIGRQLSAERSTGSRAAPAREQRDAEVDAILELARVTRQRISSRLDARHAAEEQLLTTTASLGAFVTPAAGTPAPPPADVAQGESSRRLSRFVYVNVVVVIAAIGLYVLHGTRTGGSGPPLDDRAVAPVEDRLPGADATAPQHEDTPSVNPSTRRAEAALPRTTPLAEANPATIPRDQRSTGAITAPTTSPPSDGSPQQAKATAAARVAERPDRPASPADRGAQVAERAAPGLEGGGLTGSSEGGLDELIAQAIGVREEDSHERPASSRPPPAASAPGRTSLNRADLRAGLRPVHTMADACLERFGVPGTVTLQLMIEADGTVRSAEARGAFAGTPTGDCVAKAAEAARFPAWDGRAMRVSYPLLLAR